MKAGRGKLSSRDVAKGLETIAGGLGGGGTKRLQGLTLLRGKPGISDEKGEEMNYHQKGEIRN